MAENRAGTWELRARLEDDARDPDEHDHAGETDAGLVGALVKLNVMPSIERIREGAQLEAKLSATRAAQTMTMAERAFLIATLCPHCRAARRVRIDTDRRTGQLVSVVHPGGKGKRDTQCAAWAVWLLEERAPSGDPATLAEAVQLYAGLADNRGQTLLRNIVPDGYLRQVLEALSRSGRRPVADVAKRAKLAVPVTAELLEVARRIGLVKCGADGAPTITQMGRDALNVTRSKGES